MAFEREAELYQPIARHLRDLGYQVKGEVRHLDLAAHRDGEIIGVELKRSMSLDLVLQAVERQRSVDGVYVAVPARTEGPPIRNFRRVRGLLRKLELGLILVHARPSGTRVEIRFHPAPWRARRSKRERASILREFHGRSGDRNTGGSRASRLVTAYREQAIHIACALEEVGPTSPAALRKLGTSERTGRILLDNVYGWFDHLDKGLYALHQAGREGMKEYPELIDYYSGQVRKRLTIDEPES